MVRRRIAILIGIVSLAISLTGCGGDRTVSPETTVTSQEDAEPADVKENAEQDVSNGEGQEAVDPVADQGEAVTQDNDNQDNNNIEETANEEVPALRDSVLEVMGCRIGCAATGTELDDPEVWRIVTTHFSAITLGNELKPDALVGYSVTYCPGTEMAELNGEEIEVPKLDYSRAEKLLNKILEWNESNPERKIEVRGHVLLWHAQTPEWFFHEDYDKSLPYVDKETMDKRQEWYIREVLTHFTGEDSKYKDLFYGWDVVNEAISDGTGKCRTDAENPSEDLNEDRHSSNSSWWHVYQSNEFIINAFKYANKYAPADLELYYNDYNETSMMKKKGIIELLQEIKAAEGAPGEGTRISAMGMQGHYGMDSPSFTEIQTAVEEYCKVVGNVQLTEIDISASADYDGTEASKDEENEKLRKRYNMIYFALKSAAQNEDVNVTGLTFWGTVDQYSWLQSRSNLGGGNTTGLPQLPLLFDENYEPKPCFWVFASTK